MSGLALALVYGLGGFLALQGQLAAGTVVVLALLLTRLYARSPRWPTPGSTWSAPWSASSGSSRCSTSSRSSARSPTPVAVPAGPVSVEFDDVRFSYPSADQVSLASLEDVSALDDRGGEEVLHGVSFRVEPGQTVASWGSSGAGKSTCALARRACTTSTPPAVVRLRRRGRP